MTYKEFLKTENKHFFIVVDRNNIECNCSRFNIAESVLKETVEFNPDSKQLKFIDRIASNGRIETQKELEKHMKLTNIQNNPDNKLECFLLIVLTAIVRVFLS